LCVKTLDDEIYCVHIKNPNFNPLHRLDTFGIVTKGNSLHVIDFYPIPFETAAASHPNTAPHPEAANSDYRILSFPNAGR